ncbi:glutamine synthetase [Acrasis kona]|uniref:Glutamine synthetase n=1 Tax=Acrasis kona TaxID=1008807 RepID=A0AAW2ZAN6_9EUKA
MNSAQESLLGHHLQAYLKLRRNSQLRCAAKKGMEQDFCEEGTVYSWPVLCYTTSGSLIVRLLNIRDGEFIVLNPFDQRISARHPLYSLTKISYDRTPTLPGLSDMSLFRTVFRNTEIEVYLSRDRNEIVNHIIYCLKRMKGINTDAIIANQDADYDKVSLNSDSNKHYNNVPEDDFGYVYTPSTQVGYYEFQVFGVDNKGRLYPHALGLFSGFIRHYDENRNPFSQHRYVDIKDDIQFFESSSKLVIPYEDDNFYTCIVSDKDKTILSLLLKGRSQIYKSLTNGEMEVASPKKYSNEQETSNSDFPTKFSYLNIRAEQQATSTVDEEEGERYHNTQTEIPESPSNMTSDTDRLHRQDSMTFPQQQVPPSSETSKSALIKDVSVLEHGTSLFQHKKGLLGASIKEKYFCARLAKDYEGNVFVSVTGGVKNKMTEHYDVLDIQKNENARSSVGFSDDYSFVLVTSRIGPFACSNNLLLQANDRETFMCWWNGIRRLLSDKN